MTFVWTELQLFLVSLSFQLDILRFLTIPFHEGPLLPVKKAFDFFINPGFIAVEAAGLFGGYHGILTEMDVVCYAMREPLNVIPIVLLEQFPVCDIGHSWRASSVSLDQTFTALVLATCSFTSDLGG